MHSSNQNLTDSLQSNFPLPSTTGFSQPYGNITRRRNICFLRVCDDVGAVPDCETWVLAESGVVQDDCVYVYAAGGEGGGFGYGV